MWNRTPSSPGTNWENTAYWNGGQVPGPTDRAVLPGTPPDNTCQPTLSNNAVVTLAGIYMYNNSANPGWQIRNADSNFPAKIILGSLGIGNDLGTGGGFNIYPDIELAADQTWSIDPTFGQDGPTLFGQLTGTGRLTRGGNCGTGATIYQRKNSPTFSGGVTVQIGSVMWNQLGLTSADAGTYGFGTAPITLNGGAFTWSCTGASGGGDAYVMDLTNVIVVTDSGTLAYSQAGGSGYYPNCRFSGPVSLNGLLRIWGGNIGAMAKYEGRATIDRSHYGTAGLSHGTKGAWGFDPQTYNTNIVDGAGVVHKPLVLQSCGNRFELAGTANTYAGGTVVSACGSEQNSETEYNPVVSVSASSALGTGNVLIEPGGRLLLQAAGNLAAGATVTVRRTACDLGVLSLSYDGLPAISADSEGVIGIDTGSFTALTNLSTVGNGKMFLGTGRYGGTFTGSSLAPGAGNTYRLGGGSGNSSLTLPNGVLVGNASLQVGQAAWWGYSDIILNGANTFTGATDVYGMMLMWNGNAGGGGSTLEGTAQTSAGASPFGSTNGPLTLYGSTLQLFGVSGSSEPVRKGLLTFSGFSRVGIGDWSRAYSETLQFAGLNRTNRGLLVVSPNGGNGGAGHAHLGTNEQLIITNQADSAFLPPYLVYHSLGNSAPIGPDFLYYDQTGATGMNRFTNYNGNLLTSSTNDIVQWSGGLGGGTYAAKALNMSGAITGTGTVNLGDGTYAGLILNSDFGDAGATLNFGTAEGIIYTPYGSTVSAKISGTGGITLASGSTIFNNTANDFTGDIMLEGATLRVKLDASDGAGPGYSALGNPANGIYLNGGVLSQYMSGDRIAASRTITLGPCGGYFKNISLINARITGPGALLQGLYCGTYTIGGVGNDYQGGTWVSDGPALVVNNGSTLGSGPVHVAQEASITVLGNDGICSTARLYVAATATVYLQGAAPVIGSLEDCGNVVLGSGSQASALTLGGDNADSTFYGKISEASASHPGSLTKNGSGTFTLYGNHTFTGPLTVNAGKLALLGSVAGNVVVNGGSTLTGTGGAINGNLTLGGTFASDYATAPLTVAGNITLGGAFTLPDTTRVTSVGTPVLTTTSGTISGRFTSVPVGLLLQNTGNAVILMLQPGTGVYFR